MESTGTSLDALLLQFKRDLVAALIEFLGTMLFLLMGLGGIQAAAVSNEAALLTETSRPNMAVNTVASIEQLLYISTSMGLALLAAAWTFFRVSGSVFNPNVAIALVLTGALKPMRFVLYVIAEVAGAIAASAILKGVLPGPLAVGCALGVGTKPWQGVLIEAFLTCTLTLTVLLIAVEKHRSTPFAPVAIGLVLFAAHLLGVIFTGSAMNSARAFGPAVLTHFDDYHWIYWVGPSFGAVLATIIYIFLKSVDYYALTPKQDSDDVDDSPDLKGIEVKMRRRHHQHNLHVDASRPGHTSVNMNQNPLHPSFELAREHQATSVYNPGYTTYVPGPTSPTYGGSMLPGSPTGTQQQPKSSHPLAAGIAMAGGMGLAMAGEQAHHALPASDSPQGAHDEGGEDHQDIRPATSSQPARYI